MNQTLTLACLIAAGVGLVLQNTLMVRITQSASTILIAMLLNSLVSFFVFASISGYQNVGAATTIAVLIASQLVGGLVIDLIRAHHVPLRALVGPLCGAVMLVIGAWLVARRQF
ncbi:MAG: DMT family transporter [Klebsiella michiganensis]|nr:DMT family transporter [Klebsiella michiganensis]